MDDINLALSNLIQLTMRGCINWQWSSESPWYNYYATVNSVNVTVQASRSLIGSTIRNPMIFIEDVEAKNADRKKIEILLKLIEKHYESVRKTEHDKQVQKYQKGVKILVNLKP